MNLYEYVAVCAGAPRRSTQDTFFTEVNISVLRQSDSLNACKEHSLKITIPVTRCDLIHCDLMTLRR